MNDFVTVFSLIIGVLGIILSIIGIYLSYISYVNPMIRFKKYLKKENNWEKFNGIVDNIDIYRYKNHPTFQIIIDWNQTVSFDFEEKWIRRSLCKDANNNSSHFACFFVNGMLLEKMHIISLDGHRSIVPIPHYRITKKSCYYFYDQTQLMLASIIGKYSFETNIYEFIENCSEKIYIKS